MEETRDSKPLISEEQHRALLLQTATEFAAAMFGADDRYSSNVVVGNAFNCAEDLVKRCYSTNLTPISKDQATKLLKELDDISSWVKELGDKKWWGSNGRDLCWRGVSGEETLTEYPIQTLLTLGARIDALCAELTKVQ